MRTTSTFAMNLHLLISWLDEVGLTHSYT